MSEDTIEIGQQSKQTTLVLDKHLDSTWNALQTWSVSVTNPDGLEMYAKEWFPILLSWLSNFGWTMGVKSLSVWVSGRIAF